MKKEYIKSDILINGGDCQKKQLLMGTNLRTNLSSRSHLSVAVKDVLSKFLTEKPTEQVASYLEEFVDDKIFLSNIQKKVLLSRATFVIERFLNYYKQNNLAWKKGLKDHIKYGPYEILVGCDYIYEGPDYVEIISISKSKPKLKYAGRSLETTPAYSIELFLLFLLGFKLFPNRKIVASLYHLEGKDEQFPSTEYNFEPYRGCNIISYSFDSKKDTFVQELLQKKLATYAAIKNKPLGNLEKCYNAFECKSKCNFYGVCQKKLPSSVVIKERTEKEQKVASGKPVQLTTSQQKGVDHRKGIMVINAGAGSGKTTLISKRVCLLLKEGVPPEDILLITFSNKGAEEMREKIEFWLEQEGLDIDSGALPVTTFNAWGDSIISDSYQLLGFTDRVQLLTMIKAYDLIKAVCDDVPDFQEEFPNLVFDDPLRNMPKSKGYIVELNKLFGIIKSSLIETVDELAFLIESKRDLNSFHDSNYSLLLECYNEFNSRLRQNNLIQYQDQLNLLLELIDICPKAMPSYQHILVDEFQDSDKIQLKLITFLTKQDKFTSLQCVGDDSQSIYGFRNTSPENIINFKKLFPNVKELTLPENFRSTPEIVNAANFVNNFNINKVDKQLESQLQSQNILPVFAEYTSPSEEIDAVVNSIVADIENNMKPHQIALIDRTREGLNAIKKELLKHKIPCHIDVSEVVSKNPTLPLVLEFIDFLIEPSVTAGFFDYMYLTNTTLVNSLTQTRIDGMLDALCESFINSLAKKTELELVDDFMSLFKTIATENKELLPFVDSLIEMEFSSLFEIRNYLYKFIAYEDSTSFEMEGKYEAVTLLTAHSSKGKEYDKVYLNINQFKNYTSNLSEVEETRRLLFVAITRARKELIIYCNTASEKNHREVKQDILNAINAGIIKSLM